MPEHVDLLVQGGTVVTVDSDDTVVDADVAVVGERIHAIGRDLDCSATRVLDARDCAVIPGLCNAHMHETLERGVFEDLPFMEWLDYYALPKDRAYEPRHMRASALLNQAEMIAGGTTSFIDIFRHPAEAAAVAEQSGLRATFSPQVIDSPEGAGETLARNEVFVEEWHGRASGRIRAWFGPHSLYSCEPRTFARMRDLATAPGIGIHTHCAESRAELSIVAERSGGRTPVEWLDDLVGLGPELLLAHCVELTRSDIDRLAVSGAGIAHCPTSNAKLGNGIAPVTDLLTAGANLGLGTDSNMTNNNLDLFEEMRMAALVQKQRLADPAVLPSALALRLATIGAARALGLSRDAGSIEVGKLADLAIIDLRNAHTRPLVRRGRGNVVEHLVWSCNANDVRHTVVGGLVLMEDRHLLTIDIDEVLALADAEELHLLTSAAVLDRRFPEVS